MVPSGNKSLPSQCWPWCMSPCDIARSQWVKPVLKCGQRWVIASHNGYDYRTMIWSAMEWLVLLSSTARVRPVMVMPVGPMSTNHNSRDQISGQFLFYHDPRVNKNCRNLHFRHLVALFVAVGGCVMTYINGTASDVTFGKWHHKRHIFVLITWHGPLPEDWLEALGIWPCLSQVWEFPC